MSYDFTGPPMHTPAGRAYQRANYIPQGTTSTGTIDWESPVAERGWCDDKAEFLIAEQAMQQYVADLEQRFRPGGTYDTRLLPTGEEFIEVVCGHPFGGMLLVKCFSPLLAVQLFVDAVERYVFQGRTTGTLYWRRHPQLQWFITHLETWDPDMQQQHKWEETRYNVRARLLIL